MLLRCDRPSILNIIVVFGNNQFEVGITLPGKSEHDERKEIQTIIKGDDDGNNTHCPYLRPKRWRINRFTRVLFLRNRKRPFL